MMNDDMLRNIEYLREKADVSYEEAMGLLEKFDGNVMRVLVELERQGRVYPQGGQADYDYTSQPKEEWHEHARKEAKDAKKQAAGFASQALRHRVIVERKTNEGEKEVVANLSAPYCAGATLVAPWLAVGSVALMFVMGYKVKIKKDKQGVQPQDVESFVDQTVSNIKKTASSVAQTVRGDKPFVSWDDDHKNHDNHDSHDSHDNHDNHDNHGDDNDEGGEVTIE